MKEKGGGMKGDGRGEKGERMVVRGIGETKLVWKNEGGFMVCLMAGRKRNKTSRNGRNDSPVIFTGSKD
ncbi:hypothetical protein [Aquiflexum lacus]|uniref:hypothetical protein n=1 Tax=Aquiflexum lacus TaxID=2483805 RepID=UPI0018959929|nr:hypothetical protein [Aquiflexum lacus]